MTEILLLIGDSILDNAYWNDVDKDTTAEVLKKMNINVVDRTTEEVAGVSFFQNPEGIKVGMHYVNSRKDKGIPYDGHMIKNTYYISPIPEKTNKKWWNTPKELRYAALSLGGNDLALYHNMNISDILTKVSVVIKKVIKQADILSKNFIYIIPYPPNTYISQMLQQGFNQMGINTTPQNFYKSMVDNAKIMCDQLGIQCLSLEDFTSADKGPENSIPEPTKQGAYNIAMRISKNLRTFTMHNLLDDFCNYPSIKNFNKLSISIKELLLEVSNFCVKSEIGNLKLAKKILNY